MAKGIVGTYDHEVNFWDLHPLFLTVPAFKKLKGRDRTNEDNKSSLIMWAFILVYDTGDDNPFRNIAEEERKLEIAENVLNNKKFDWDKYEYVKEALIPMVTTEAQRQRDSLHRKMGERQKFIDNTKYSLDEYVEDLNTGKFKLKKGTVDQLDRMITGTVKLYEDLARIDKLILMDESTENKNEVSESESGLI